MTEQKVSIIIPVVRPEGADKCRDAIYKNAGIPMGQYELIRLKDTKRIGCPQMVKRLTKMAQHDLVMFLGDDTVPQPGFLKAALEEMAELPDGWGVVGLNTNGDKNTANPLAHWLAHKKMLDILPGGDFFATEYKHCWCDNELADIAMEHGRWRFAKDSIVKHEHPLFGTADEDDHYNRVYADDVKEFDRKRFLYRKLERNRDKFGVRLGIGEPLTDDKIYSHFHFSSTKIIINHLLHLFKTGQSVSIDFLIPDFPGSIDAVRNNLVHKALQLGCTHLIMMDTDQIYNSPDMIERMLAHDKPVVGGKVHRRYPPFDPLMMRGRRDGEFRFVDDKEIEAGGIIEVDATGCGCVLYDMNVFIDIDHPWFETETGEHGQTVGEDIAFCKKLRDSGYKIFVDCDIDIQHLSLLAIDWGTHKLYKKLREVQDV